MTPNLFAALRKQKRKVAVLEAKIAHKLALELSGIPAKFGFDSAAAFIKAVRNAGKPVSKSARKAKKAKAGKRRRAKITPEIQERVIALVKAGKTGAAIAKEYKISLPSVQKIKKAAGLTKTRGIRV